MTNFDEIIAKINERIWTNGKQKITGAILNDVLKAMLSSIADNIDNVVISEDNIADGAVATVKLRDGSVTTLKIADGAVTIGKIADRSVNHYKIEERQVWEENIGDSSVSRRTIQDGAVTSEKIANGAVTSGKIANGAVTSEKIANGAVTSEKIADMAVRDRHVANNSINASAKLRDGSVTKDKLAQELIDAVDAKLDKVDYKAAHKRVYIVNSNGSQGVEDVRQGATPSTIVERDSEGCIGVGTPTANGHAATKLYVDEATEDKLPKATDSDTAPRVYAVDESGEQMLLRVKRDPEGNSIVRRNAAGAIQAASPSGNTDVTPKKYVDDKLKEKLSVEISAVTDNLQRVYAIDTDGEQKIMKVAPANIAGTIASRNSKGILAVSDPETELHATNKQYVDNLFASALKQFKMQKHSSSEPLKRFEISESGIYIFQGRSSADLFLEIRPDGYMEYNIIAMIVREMEHWEDVDALIIAMSKPSLSNLSDFYEISWLKSKSGFVVTCEQGFDMMSTAL